VGDDSNLKKSVDEIKKLQEEISALRQENIQLKVILLQRIKTLFKTFLVVFRMSYLLMGLVYQSLINLSDCFDTSLLDGGLLRFMLGSDDLS
jgi:hypothetical protein